MTAVDFLRKTGADKSYPVEGRTVVVGGGNVAIDVAAHRDKMRRFRSVYVLSGRQGTLCRHPRRK